MKPILLSVKERNARKMKQMQNKIEKAQEIVNDINSKNLDDELFKSAYDFIRLGQEEKGLEAIKQFLENPKVWNAWFCLDGL